MYKYRVWIYKDGNAIFNLQFAESGQEISRSGSKMDLFADIVPSMFVEVAE